MPKKLLCFDLDGTLTPHSTWEAFNTRLGISKEDDQRLFGLYKEGNLDYKDWTKELVRLYKEHPLVTKEDITEVASSVALHTDVSEVINSAKAKGYHVVILSGAIDVMVQPIAQKLGVEDWFAANKAVFNENNELIDIEDSGHERDAKVFLLKDFCAKNNYELSNVIAVGDGGNDAEIFKVIKGILVGNNKELAPLAWKQINNLSELEVLL